MWILLLLFLLFVPSHLSFHSRFMRTEETTKTNIILLVLCEMWIRMTDMKFRQRLLGFFVFSRRFSSSHMIQLINYAYFTNKTSTISNATWQKEEKKATISVCVCVHERKTSQKRAHVDSKNVWRNVKFIINSNNLKTYGIHFFCPNKTLCSHSRRFCFN